MKTTQFFLIFSLVVGFGLFNTAEAEASGIETATFAGGCFGA
jgi:hypothetical protein